jgi:hypothetical protein
MAPFLEHTFCQKPLPQFKKKSLEIIEPGQEYDGDTLALFTEDTKGNIIKRV